MSNDVERDVVHRSVRGGDRTLPHHPGRRRNAGCALGRFRKPEECERITAADVEEEVLSHASRQIDRLGQRHSEYVRVEVHRPRHVLTDQRQMIDTVQLEFFVLLRLTLC